MQRIPPLRPVMKRSYLNLDAIFGHIFSNLTGEMLTPTRIATFYLLRLLFETHFGKKHVVSGWPFTQKEKAYVFQCLYGFMSLEGEISYTEFRIAVRRYFIDSRMITRHFYMAMEQLGSGKADINMYIEDEFYTNKYAKNPDGSKIGHYERFVQRERQNCPFSSSHSHMYRWMKRLMAQYAKTDEREMFKINQCMRKWINSHTDAEFVPNRDDKLLQISVDCSMRAREWVDKQLFWMEKRPIMAFRYCWLLHFSKAIQKRHTDVYEAYLLEALGQIQLRKCESAIKAMKSFFDYTMLDLNENMTHCSRTFRLAVPNTVPLLYAPLLCARVYRTFGDYEMARHLLQESLQQAQLHNEDICHQLANLEILIIEILGNRAILEDNELIVPLVQVEEDRRVQQKALRNLEDVVDLPLPQFPCCSQTEDEYEMCSEMDALGKQLIMLRMIVKGKYKLETEKLTEPGLFVPTVVDLRERAYKMETYAFSIMMSNFVRNGMFTQALQHGKQLLFKNMKIGDKKNFYENESHIIVLINMAYAAAALGDYRKARYTYQDATVRYPRPISWQCTRHLSICQSVMAYEDHLLKLNFEDCEKQIQIINAHSKFEAKIRKALLFACYGKYKDGVAVLESIDTPDVMSRIRIHMQMASILTVMSLFEKAEAELEEAIKLSNTTTFFNIPSMINRRLANVMMARGEHAKACVMLNSCAPDIMHYGTQTEKMCLNMALAINFRKLRRDPRIFLKQVRHVARKDKWTAMEQLVVAELALLHSPDGLFPDPDLAAMLRERFMKFKYTEKKFSWMLI